MKFECGDLERAFANPDLMPEARAHIKSCAACRREYRLWMDISSSAAELHEDWETPGLWPRILQDLEAEQRQKSSTRPLWQNWRAWAVAAALLIGVSAALLFMPRQQTAVRRQDQDFLTEQALKDVEKNEAAYRKSIDQLTHLAEPKLENSASASAVNAREKLLMLDAAIADTRTNVASNRFNTHLQTTLADLYREKQQTLKELLTSAKTN